MPPVLYKGRRFFLEDKRESFLFVNYYGFLDNAGLFVTGVFYDHPSTFAMFSVIPTILITEKELLYSKP